LKNLILKWRHRKDSSNLDVLPNRDKLFKDSIFSKKTTSNTKMGKKSLKGAWVQKLKATRIVLLFAGYVILGLTIIFIAEFLANSRSLSFFGCLLVFLIQIFLIMAFIYFGFDLADVLSVLSRNMPTKQKLYA
jgi:uncharacterized protein YacL